MGLKNHSCQLYNKNPNLIDNCTLRYKNLLRENIIRDILTIKQLTCSIAKIRFTNFRRNHITDKIVESNHQPSPCEFRSWPGKYGVTVDIQNSLNNGCAGVQDRNFQPDHRCSFAELRPHVSLSVYCRRRRWKHLIEIPTFRARGVAWRSTARNCSARNATRITSHQCE